MVVPPLSSLRVAYLLPGVISLLPLGLFSGLGGYLVAVIYLGRSGRSTGYYYYPRYSTIIVLLILGIIDSVSLLSLVLTLFKLYLGYLVASAKKVGLNI